MAHLAKPTKAQDVRVLHRDVRKLVDGINSLVNMTVEWKGKERGYGFLTIRNSASEVVIKVADPGAGLSGGSDGGLFLPNISVTSTKNPSKEFESIQFIINVLGAADGSTVRLSANNSPVGLYVLANQVAITETFAPAAGEYRMRADFSGDVSHQSGFAVMTQVVLEKPVPQIVIGSSKNPSDHNEDIFFAVNMSMNVPAPPPLPTGQIAFYYDDHLLNTVPLDSAGFANSGHIASLEGGHHRIEGRYSGDSEWGAVTATMDQIVRESADLVMVIDPEPVQTGRQFIIYIAVRAVRGLPTPTGQVDIHENGTTSGWFDLDGRGQASFSVAAGLPIGTYTWFFDYSGDGNYSPDFSPIFIQHVVARPPTSLDILQVGNNGSISYRLYANWPTPEMEALFIIQIHDPTGGNYNGLIGIQLDGYGGFGSVDVKQGGELIWRGGVNLYFNAVPMVGNTIYFNMVNGYQTLWISWNIPPVPVWYWDGPTLESYGTPYNYGNPAYVFMHFFDPYDGRTIDSFGGPSGFLNP